MNVAVVGLGKIGLPLAVQLAGRGLDVVGLDISERVVAAVNAGQEPFPGEAELAERLLAAVTGGRLRATTDPADAVGASEVVVVVVPLVVDAAARPDFGALDAATAAIAPSLRRGVLVSYETTLPVHTTRRRFARALAEGSGLALGVDLFVCHSPERVFSGRIFADLRRYPKLVGGVDEASAKRAVAFYESALEFDPRADLDRPNGVWDLGSAEAAELAKLAETTYRDLNIAFANELAMGAESIGVDVREVIAASNSQPFSHIHQPGIAVGGHCIPVYPHFLLDSVPGLRLPAVAREVNRSMPLRAVEAISRELGGLQGRRIAVLGLAYRPGVKEHAFSGAFDVVKRVEELGGTALVHDPLYTDEELQALGLVPFRQGEHVDAMVVQTDHELYRTWFTEGASSEALVYDGRGLLPGGVGARVIRLGTP